MQGERLVRAGNFFIELSKGIIVFIVIILLLHFFVATIFSIKGKSMMDNFEEGEYVLINKLSYIISLPERGDIVILKFPGDPDKTKYIKRIIGLPGEKIIIKNSKVTINDKMLSEIYLSFDKNITEPDLEINLKNNEYFVMGDNRPNSSDSRTWGVATKNLLIGKALFFLFPMDKWGYIPKVYY